MNHSKNKISLDNLTLTEFIAIESHLIWNSSLFWMWLAGLSFLFVIAVLNYLRVIAIPGMSSRFPVDLVILITVLTVVSWISSRRSGAAAPRVTEEPQTLGSPFSALAFVGACVRRFWFLFSIILIPQILLWRATPKILFKKHHTLLEWRFLNSSLEALFLLTLVDITFFAVGKRYFTRVSRTSTLGSPVNKTFGLVLILSILAGFILASWR